MSHFEGQYQNPGTAFLAQFIYGVSHDLGAPLRHIVQFSNLLQNQANAKLDDKELLWLKIMADAGQTAQQMSESLLYLSRLATQRSVPVPCDVLKLIDEEIAILKLATDPRITTAINKANIRVQGTVGECCLIESHWRTLISQLVKNAIIFQSASAEHKPDVVLTLEKTSSGIHFCVEDNGIGVKSDSLSLITSPFKRFNHELDYPGIGIGLTYVAYIALLNNAVLEFGESSLGGLQVIYREMLAVS